VTITASADTLERAIIEQSPREEIDGLMRALDVPLQQLVATLEKRLPAEDAATPARAAAPV
jgi:hypothetical protein